jgi:hypothetical protein
MKLGYLLSVAIIPLVLGTSPLSQGNKDKGQKENKGGNSNSEKFEKQKDKKDNRERDNEYRGKNDDDRQNNADRKYKNDDRYENQKGNKQIGKDRNWKEDDRWEDGRWDDDRFDARMKKLKGFKKDKWVNSVYYNDVIWFNGDRGYYTSKGPKGNKKVSICHKPNGNDFPVAINVSENAVKAHLNHGDYIGECRDFDRSRYSDNYWNTRNNYYNQYSQTTETLSFGEQLLAVAIDRLTNARNTMVPLRSTLQEDELRRKDAAIINLQNDVYNLQNSLARSNEQVGLQVNVKF